MTFSKKFYMAVIDIRDAGAKESAVSLIRAADSSSARIGSSSAYLLHMTADAYQALVADFQTLFRNPGITDADVASVAELANNESFGRKFQG